MIFYTKRRHRETIKASKLRAHNKFLKEENKLLLRQLKTRTEEIQFLYKTMASILKIK